MEVGILSMGNTPGKNDAGLLQFTRAGWLQRYIDFRIEHPLPSVLPSHNVKMLEDTGLHNRLDEAVYTFLQPTGLLYGFPVETPFSSGNYPGREFPADGNDVYFTFLESLFACLVADRHFLLENLSDEEDHFLPVLDVAHTYFTQTGGGDPGSALIDSLSQWIGKGPKPFAHFEKEIQHRLDHKNKHLNLTGFYYNSFLFLDIYYCMLWQRESLWGVENPQEVLSKLAAGQAELRYMLIRLMISSATSSGEIISSEKRLIEWFLKSSRLPRAQKSQLRSDLKKGLNIDQIEFSPQPWIVRRFLLESVMMTMLVDRDLSTGEERFLHEAVEKLELWEGELNQSLMALELFILNQEEHLQIFQDTPFVLNVGRNLSRRITGVLKKNLDRIINEIKETQELYHLLAKSAHTPLNPEEKDKVKAQLLDILRTIPALAIFALPGGGLILPILIKLLPFNILPSSFEN